MTTITSCTSNGLDYRNNKMSNMIKLPFAANSKTTGTKGLSAIKIIYQFIDNVARIQFVKGNGFKLKFKNDFMLNYYYVDNGNLCYDIDEFRWYGYSTNKKGLLDNFKEDLLADWEAYVECPEENLSIDAIELRNKLISLVTKVNDI